MTDGLAEAAKLHAITLETAPVIDRITGAQSLIEPGSRWVLMSHEKLLLESDLYLKLLAKNMQAKRHKVLWTDDFSNLIEVLDRE